MKDILGCLHNNKGKMTYHVQAGESVSSSRNTEEQAGESVSSSRGTSR